MHNFNTTNVQSESALSTNMQIIDTALDNEIYHYWACAAMLEDCGDTASPTYRTGDFTIGIPSHWRFADGVSSGVCIYVRRHPEWRNGVLGVVAHYSTTAIDGDVRWRATITPIKDNTTPTATTIGLAKSPPLSTGKITTVELKDSTMSESALIDPSHIGILVSVGRNGGAASDTNTGVVWLYGIDIIYRETKRVVGSK